MSDLKPGDLCVILRPNDNLPPGGEKYIGMHVILKRISDYTGVWAPYWIVTRAPDNWQFSHEILRKLQPPPLEEDVDEYDEVHA